MRREVGHLLHGCKLTQPNSKAAAEPAVQLSTVHQAGSTASEKAQPIKH